MPKDGAVVQTKKTWLLASLVLRENCCKLQTERGQKEISAAKVREVESELSSAQINLKAERLLLQQASTPCACLTRTVDFKRLRCRRLLVLWQSR